MTERWRRQIAQLLERHPRLLAVSVFNKLRAEGRGVASDGGSRTGADDAMSCSSSRALARANSSVRHLTKIRSPETGSLATTASGPRRGRGRRCGCRARVGRAASCDSGAWTADHLVVRSATGCDGWPPWATLCPKPVPGSERTLATPSTTRPNAPAGTLPRFHCQGEGRGFESRRPLESPAQRVSRPLRPRG